MATRWEITKAVRASDLPAPSRLIMLVLADVAEVGTAEIPQQFTPSVSVLAAETGLSKRTVQAHLSALEEAGWIARMRPATAEAMWRGDRVRYRLTVPNGLVQEMPEGGAGVAEGGAVDAPGVVQELHQGGAGDAPLETDLIQITSDPKSSSSSAKPTKVERPDVDKICRHLADKIVDNGSRRPVITAAWRTEARLLLDKDGRTVDQVINAINWCQADPFWRSNILSMPTLRAKYDQLRLAAERQRANGRASPKDSTTGLRVGAALDLAAEFDRKALTA
jgi:DNA-binding transcriptional ArsR family regulator